MFDHCDEFEPPLSEEDYDPQIDEAWIDFSPLWHLLRLILSTVIITCIVAALHNS